SCFFLSSRRRHTRSKRDWSSDVCSSDLGAGDTAFMAGADITEFPERNAADSIAVHPVFNKIEHIPKPTIALLNGFTLGGGFELRSEERRVGKECRGRWGST